MYNSGANVYRLSEIISELYETHFLFFLSVAFPPLVNSYSVRHTTRYAATAATCGYARCVRLQRPHALVA